MGDGIQLALRVARHVGALGQVLAQQPIGVLVGAVLPRL
jgi:predicted transcriptional regulator